MDYVEGDTFARLLARSAQNKTPIPFAVTVRILLDTLAGLHAAHEMTDDMGQPLDIVHRDVSPQNVLVGVDGIARITDFGVARAASRLSTTRSGQLKGKLAYMAPEQARGGGIDRRADVFSCGIVLWEALALKRLFKGDGEAETLNRVLYEPIPAPSSVRPEIPPALDAVCMKALARELGDRYPTALAMADDLEKAAHANAAMGSVRDVAACLEQVVGSDLSQQREAVRAWLNRSEPSKPSRPGGFTGLTPAPRSRPGYLDSTKTRVEGATKSEPSAAADKVSSVSSAVLQVTSPTQPAEAAAATPRSRAKWLAAIAAVAVIAGGIGFGASRLATKTPAPAAALPPAPSPAPSPSPTHAQPSITPAPAPAPAAEASATASASVAAPEGPAAKPATSASARAVRPAVRPAATPRPGTTSTGASTPDDLLRNPYR
jgi:serine/threonine-protein kinase